MAPGAVANGTSTALGHSRDDIELALAASEGEREPPCSRRCVAPRCSN